MIVRSCVDGPQPSHRRDASYLGEGGCMTETFHEFVVHRSPALSRRAYLLTGDHQLAEDLLQSALAKTYRHWRRSRDGDPEADVRRGMYHQQVSWWRRRRVTERLESEPTEQAGA